MPKITKANHSYFRAKAKAAHLQRLEARRKAEELTKSLLTATPTKQARVAVTVQLAVLHEAVLAEIGKLSNGKIKGTRLSELAVVQGELLRQLKDLGEGGPMDKELKAMVHDDPELIAGVQDGVREVFDPERIQAESGA